jgi:uncharacterized membrane protein YbhN (UPF0104 family)
VLVAPSGLGVREAIMVALLEPSIGFVAAGIVAISMRIVMTATELVLMIWGAWPWLRSRKRGASEDGKRVTSSATQR